MLAVMYFLVGFGLALVAGWVIVRCRLWVGADMIQKLAMVWVFVVWPALPLVGLVWVLGRWLAYLKRLEGRGDLE